MRLSCPPITHLDEPFLFVLYSSTRTAEMKLVPWSEEQKKSFINFQFQAQHQHYITKYPLGSFQLIELDGERIGRLYVCELTDEVRVIDIIIAPEFRGRGIGSELLNGILRSAAKPVRIYLENFNSSRELFERLGFQMISDEGIYQLWECRAVGEQVKAAA